MRSKGHIRAAPAPPFIICGRVLRDCTMGCEGHRPKVDARDGIFRSPHLSSWPAPAFRDRLVLPASARREQTGRDQHESW
jgi:hypothetical protein